MSIKNKNKAVKDASDRSGFLCLAAWQAAGQGQSQSVVFTTVDMAQSPALETTRGSTSARCILQCPA